MTELREWYEERVVEIEDYVRFILAIEQAVGAGGAKIGDDGFVISVTQQRIVNASIFLHLYNLVEATITACLDEVSKETMSKIQCGAADLSESLRNEWIRFVARTHIDSGPDKRLKNAITLCEFFISSLPVAEFNIEKGGGGNWDDSSIDSIAKRIGLKIKLPRDLKSAIKRPIRDDRGALSLVVELRNALAHGRMSFQECGREDTASDLKSLADNVVLYLREVVNSFASYIEKELYLVEASRGRAA